jgi:hypothetical protein
LLDNPIIFSRWLRNNICRKRSEIKTPVAIRKTLFITLQKSSFDLLKKQTDIYPFELSEIITLTNTMKVLNRLSSPYPSGEINLASIINKTKLIPLFRKEKNVNRIPFLNVWLLLIFSRNTLDELKFMLSHYVNRT